MERGHTLKGAPPQKRVRRPHNKPAYVANLVRFAGRNVEDLGNLVDFDADLDFNEDGPNERDEYNANPGLVDQGCRPPVAKTRRV
ncbi:hypothetical protein FRC12_004827 [Ceratobasidium sp. 428]|nr:hypothetical protein FRC12_004827 [Ceratobasidium sp. 428]